ncbi:MAG: cytochrome c-type biogenesis protein CcmH [Myxococcales bacterium]|nr:cytochrome c-type biogenesis protein CcmH [Myxococcales bacterium]MBK7194628.1 cytochrome c-type biogenesis protein CcmH [Myxococcales bacterium]MBP6842268.1 cytochrome c-type biogenesis protein CcmH [Kofleriaceae bacterium]
MRVLLVIAIAAAVLGCGGRRTSGDAAHELEQRLVAPCCWRQNVADHDSPIANQIRQEIRARLAAGDSPAAIEEHYVATYGPEVRALGTPRDDPRGAIGRATIVMALLGLALVAWITRRLVRRAPPAAAAAPPPARDAAAEERLDDELALVD